MYFGIAVLTTLAAWFLGKATIKPFSRDRRVAWQGVCSGFLLMNTFLPCETLPKFLFENGLMFIVMRFVVKQYERPDTSKPA